MSQNLTLRTLAGLHVPYARHPAVRKLKRQGHLPSIHGTKLWGASHILIDFLSKGLADPPRSIIDVGCGWGLAGIWCAKAYGAEVAAVDADPNVMPFLQLVADLNDTTVTSVVARFEDLQEDLLASTDWLIAADICFWDELIEPVTNMIARAIESGTRRVIIADPQRAPFLRVAETILQEYGGELIEWRSDNTRTAGALLVIENH